MMYKLFFLSIIIVVCLVSSCKINNDSDTEQHTPIVITNSESTNTEQKQNYKALVFQLDSLNPQKGFGYDILIDGSRFIHQTNIPSIQGNNGFQTKEKAELVAQLMIYKLKQNIMPPSISKKELDSLHILN